MNFKIIVLFYILVGCSSNHIAPMKKVLLIKQPSMECQKKVKSLKHLARYQKKNDSISWLKKTSLKDICSLQSAEIANNLELHQNKIGIIYESRKENAKESAALLEGLLSFDKSIYVIQNPKNNKANIDRSLSELILKKKVGLIISWGSEKFTHYIKKWQDRLDISTVFIGSQFEGKENTFKLFPNIQNYGKEIVFEMKRKGVKKIAFLTPASSEKSNFLKAIKDKIVKSGIEITYDEIYDANNYDSMNMSCRKIFKIDRNARWDEYKYILRSEKRKANAEGYKLNPKLVFLPAQVDYDAIFIPDNFKIVNHFLKLFEYYKMPKIALFGTHEWRSSDLTKARSPYLAGASFVDFIGDPSKLPEKVNNSKNNLGLNTDYKLMGHYAGLLGSMAIKASKKRKSLVTKALNKIRINDGFFDNNRAFIQNEFNWPSFSFEVQNGHIELTKK